MFGEHLRAAVLDGVIDPSLTGLEAAVGQMVGFARTIDEMFAWCRTNPICAVKGDPTEMYDLLLEQLDVAPSVDSAGTVVLDPARAILAGVVASYTSDFWPVFFTALAAAVDGDGTMFGQLGEAYIGIADLGAFTSINCTDGGAATRAELDALTAALAEVAGDFGVASAVSGFAVRILAGGRGHAARRSGRRAGCAADPGWSATAATTPLLTSGRCRWPASSPPGYSSATTAASTPATA